LPSRTNSNRSRWLMGLMCELNNDRRDKR